MEALLPNGTLAEAQQRAWTVGHETAAAVVKIFGRPITDDDDGRVTGAVLLGSAATLAWALLLVLCAAHVLAVCARRAVRVACAPPLALETAARAEDSECEDLPVEPCGDLPAVFPAQEGESRV